MKQKIIVCLASVCAVFVLIHNAIIILSDAPVNPLSMKYQKEISRYMNPLFTQNWHLFAPTPISENYVVSLQVKRKDHRVSEWYDVTNDLVAANNESRISPINRIVRIPSGTIQQMFQRDEVSNKVIEKTKDRQLREKYEKALAKSKHEKVGEQLLYRYAFARATELVAADEIDSVRVRFISEKAKPYSERRNEAVKREREYIDFAWKRYEYVTPIF